MEGLFHFSEEKKMPSVLQYKPLFSTLLVFVIEVWQNSILKTRKLSSQVLFFFEIVMHFLVGLLEHLQSSRGYFVYVRQHVS
jgi:hypothetical protein